MPGSAAQLSPERLGVCGMSRMIKVFASGRGTERRSGAYQVVEAYPAFVIVDVSDAESTALAADHLVEDITDQYAIPLGGDAASIIDASRAAHHDTGHDGGASRLQGREAPAPGTAPLPRPVRRAGEAGVARRRARCRRRGGRHVRRVHGRRARRRRPDRGIAQLPVVRWAGHLPTDARVSVADPDAPPLPRTKLLPDTVTVEFFTPREARKGRAEIRKLGLRIASADVEAGVLVVELPEGTAASQRRLIEAISQIHGVRMVRRKALNRISNDIAVGPMRAGAAALGAARPRSTAPARSSRSATPGSTSARPPPPTPTSPGG